MVVLDLLFAGMETTATTLKWGFLYVMLNLRVQDKIQEELDQFPSKITLSHKNSCPYTCATINVSFIWHYFLTYHKFHGCNLMRPT